MWTKGIILATLMTLTGCMTTEARWNTDQLNQFKYDCGDPYQKGMLESQRVSSGDKIRNTIILSSLTGTFLSMKDGTYRERRNIHEGRRSTVQYETEYQREKFCQQKAYYKSLNLR